MSMEELYRLIQALGQSGMVWIFVFMVGYLMGVNKGWLDAMNHRIDEISREIRDEIHKPD